MYPLHGSHNHNSRYSRDKEMQLLDINPGRTRTMRRTSHSLKEEIEREREREESEDRKKRKRK